jgi:hypothetical protein
VAVVGTALRRASVFAFDVALALALAHGGLSSLILARVAPITALSVYLARAVSKHTSKGVKLAGDKVRSRRAKTLVRQLRENGIYI